MGEEGQRKFGDFNDLMQKGGTMSNLNMGPEQNEKVRTLCELTVKTEMPALVERIEKAVKKKRRLIDMKMKEEVRVLGSNRRHISLRTGLQRCSNHRQRG
jgi:hypothetical protein